MVWYGLDYNGFGVPAYVVRARFDFILGLYWDSAPNALPVDARIFTLSRYVDTPGRLVCAFGSQPKNMVDIQIMQGFKVPFPRHTKINGRTVVTGILLIVSFAF